MRVNRLASTCVDGSKPIPATPHHSRIDMNKMIAVLVAALFAGAAVTAQAASHMAPAVKADAKEAKAEVKADAKEVKAEAKADAKEVKATAKHKAKKAKAKVKAEAKQAKADIKPATK